MAAFVAYAPTLSTCGTTMNLEGWDGIYLDPNSRLMVDIGDNTTVENGQVFLTNNNVTMRGRAQGVVEWLDYNIGTCTATPTITAKIRYTSAASGLGWTMPVAEYGCTDTTWTWDAVGATTCMKMYKWPADAVTIKKPEDRLREIMQSRCTPRIITSKNQLPSAADIREQRARETLRRVLGERRFQDFLRKGFVTVPAKSGLTYQIFPAHKFTNVWNRGTLVEKLCVVLQGNFPPTDSLIMRYLMILNNEDQFRSYAIKHAAYPEQRYPAAQPDMRTLPEIYAALKPKKAA